MLYGRVSREVFAKDPLKYSRSVLSSHSMHDFILAKRWFVDAPLSIGGTLGEAIIFKRREKSDDIVKDNHLEMYMRQPYYE